MVTAKCKYRFKIYTFKEKFCDIMWSFEELTIFFSFSVSLSYKKNIIYLNNDQNGFSVCSISNYESSHEQLGADLNVNLWSVVQLIKILLVKLMCNGD